MHLEAIASKNALADTGWSKAMRQLFLAVLFVLLVPAGAYPQSRKQNRGANRAVILWDTWGLPHIVAKDTESAARAFGPAQVPRHTTLSHRQVAQTRGRR